MSGVLVVGTMLMGGVLIRMALSGVGHKNGEMLSRYRGGGV